MSGVRWREARIRWICGAASSAFGCTSSLTEKLILETPQKKSNVFNFICRIPNSLWNSCRTTKGIKPNAEVAVNYNRISLHKKRRGGDRETSLTNRLTNRKRSGGKRPTTRKGGNMGSFPLCYVAATSSGEVVLKCPLQDSSKPL
ncbi:Hypothetical predicted protein [Podarcis lilfordi]|uniref:Uncharacterized protein n=1 Tax=Podarcis lilfordi TaxID=74358 RepID=A0AA35KRZ1_9SAUR|nr:Hypothetical predicted protein [Podarcis lilfordi]